MGKMLSYTPKLINLLTPPIFDDEDKTLVAHHLFIIVSTFMAVGWLAILIALIIPETVYRWLLVVGVIESAGLVLLALNKYGHTRLVSNLLIFIIWAAATGMALTGGGTSSNAMALYLIIVFIAGLVLSGKAGVITAVLCSLTGLFLVYLEYSGTLPVNRVPHTPVTQWIANTIYMAIIISLQYLVSRTIRKALKQSRQELNKRQRVDAALRESEERYRKLFENANEAIFVAQDGKLVFLNPRTAMMIGYSNEEAVAKPFVEFIHPDDRDMVIDRHVRRMKGEELPHIYSFQIIHRDGNVRWVELNTVLINWEGNPATLNFLSDVTERKQAEEALRLNLEIGERLAEETAVIAEIGRLIGSTLDIEEVYERFAAEARKLIPFDRLAVNLFNIRENTLTIAYVSGADISDRKRGDSPPLAGTLTKEVIHGRTGLIIQPESIDEIVSRIPGLFPTFQAGLRSLLSVPLISRDEVIGVLHFRTKKPNAYKEQDLRLAERIGAQIAGAIANTQLFTDLKKTEMSLRVSEGRFRSLVEQAAVGVAEIEMSTGRFFTVNRRLCEVVGRTEEELLATTFQMITHPEDLHLHEEKTALLLAGKISSYELEKRYFRKDGKIVWVNITVSPLWKRGETPGRNMIVVEDITARKQVEEALKESEQRYRELSIIDDLTRLYNSRHFYFQLKIELDRSNRYGQPLTLLLLDIDNFKAFNDAYGHVEGDHVLMRLGQVVKRCLRETDFAYRYGGEEFTILLPMTTSTDGAITAERIRMEFKKETFSPTPSQDVHVTVSIGLAQYKPQEEMKAFVHRVDQLMYQGKKGGKDRVCSEP